MKEKLSKWVEVSGRALELRVARTFRQSARDKDVFSSVAYKDPHTGKVREADVVVRYRIDHTLAGDLQSPWALDLTIECKSSIDKPWVVFTEGSTPQSGADALANWSIVDAAYAPAVAEGKPYGYQLPTTLAFSAVPGTHVVAASLGKGSKSQQDSTNDKDPAVDAVKQVTSAAFGVVETHDPASATPGETYIGLPVIVTRAPLYECALDTAGEQQFVEVRHAAVVDPEGRGCIVTVLREDYLSEWVGHFEAGLAGAENIWW